MSFRNLLVSILLFFQAIVTYGVSSGERHWAWRPLFNHRTADSVTPVDLQRQENAKVELQKKLIHFLENNKNGVGSEYISQEELAELLRDIVAAQLKQKDLLGLIQDYSSRKLTEVGELCRQDKLRCQDGYSVLVSFLAVQNRMEEIESGQLDVHYLPEAQREVFSRNRFLCFYYDFLTEKAIGDFKKAEIDQLRTFTKTVTPEDQRSLVQTVVDLVKGRSSEPEVIEKPLLSESEITSILQGWDQRLLVAKCWRRERILQWKGGFLLQQMPEVLDPSRLSVVY